MKMRFMLTGVRSEKGFTLIEILIVVFIISLILAIAVPNYTKSTEKAQEELCRNTRKMAEASLSLYILDKKKNGTSGITFQELIDEGYLKEEPLCPSGGTYTIGTGQNGTPVIQCSIHP